MTKKKFSQRICVLSALLSLLATTLSSWFIMQILYQKTPEYEEFVTGYTTWTGYYKQGDMTLGNLVTISVLIFFLLFAFFLRMLSGKITWLSGSIDRKQEYGEKFRINCKKADYIIFLLIFSRFTLGAICGLLDLREILPFLQILLVIPVGIYSWLYVRHGKIGLMKQALTLSQILLPLSFLLICTYRYEYQGEIISLYHSGKMILVCSLSAAVLILWNLFQTVKRRKEEKPFILLSSLGIKSVSLVMV